MNEIKEIQNLTGVGGAFVNKFLRTLKVPDGPAAASGAASVVAGVQVFELEDILREFLNRKTKEKNSSKRKTKYDWKKR